MRTENDNAPCSALERPEASEREAFDNEPGLSSPRQSASTRRWLGPLALFGAIAAAGGGLVFYKAGAQEQSLAAAANQPEYSEVVSVATAGSREHVRTTTSIGTVVALRSVALRNEVAGTVMSTNLTPGQVVEAGAVLVALDVSVEEAELRALEAQAALARNLAERMDRALKGRATSQIELDRARAELDVAEAQKARTEAVIARKTIRAPFRARIGLSDVHPGQYLNEGSFITTLQGVDAAAHVDFMVPQLVAQTLHVGDTVTVVASPGSASLEASIVAIDARVDTATRNIGIRARVDDANALPPPGASVRVAVPAGEPMVAVSIPVNALRKGPGGDHVFVVARDEEGKPRSSMRRVNAGPVIGDEVLILSGLEAGDEVASFGSFKLMEGTLVTIADQANAAALN